MRLLTFDCHGELSLTVDFIEHIPSYAILSHRWGAEGDEVTFSDVKDGSGKNKAGHDKIQFCGEQARKDGLQYFWVDTCCIDKRNSAELSEAINSMYNWYRCAQLCYVYLDDVELEQGIKSFHCSKWFSRGWTLQELLSPRLILFYDRNWQFLGDKMVLSSEISLVTGVDRGALETGNIRKFSIAQKMSWAAGRLTSRVEDIAYCLMGLFDVNMPLLYGEGERAFRRLQEEIIKNDDDQTIFAWSMGTETVSGLLAPSPAHFTECGHTTSLRSFRGRQPFSITNRGLSIKQKITPWAANTYLAYLECTRKLSHPSPPWERRIGIFLRRLTEDDQYARVNVSGESLMLDMNKSYSSDDRPHVERQLFVRHHVDLEEEENALKDRMYGFRIPDAWLPSSASVFCVGDRLNDGFAVLPMGGFGLAMILDVSAERKGLKRIALGFDFDFNPVCLLEDSFRDENASKSKLDEYLDWPSLFTDDFNWCEVHEGRVYRQERHNGIWALKGHRLYGLDVVLLASPNHNGSILELLHNENRWEVLIDDLAGPFACESNRKVQRE